MINAINRSEYIILIYINFERRSATMSPTPDAPPPPKSEQKMGGLFSQFLEFFGMTPSLPSEYLTRNETDSVEKTVVWRCRSCHNPAKWLAKEERWHCPNHPNADIVDQL